MGSQGNFFFPQQDCLLSSGQTPWENKAVLIQKCVIQTNALHLQTTLLCWVAGGDSLGITRGLDRDTLSCVMDRTGNEGYLLEVGKVLHNKIIVGEGINKNEAT